MGNYDSLYINVIWRGLIRDSFTVSGHLWMHMKKDWLPSRVLGAGSQDTALVLMMEWGAKNMIWNLKAWFTYLVQSHICCTVSKTEASHQSSIWGRHHHLHSFKWCGPCCFLLFDYSEAHFIDNSYTTYSIFSTRHINECESSRGQFTMHNGILHTTRKPDFSYSKQIQ